MATTKAPGRKRKRSPDRAEAQTPELALPYDPPTCLDCGYNLSHWLERPKLCPACGAALSKEASKGDTRLQRRLSHSRIYLWLWIAVLVPPIFCFSSRNIAVIITVIFVGSLTSGLLAARLVPRPAIGFLSRALLLAVVTLLLQSAIVLLGFAVAFAIRSWP